MINNLSDNAKKANHRHMDYGAMGYLYIDPIFYSEGVKQKGLKRLNLLDMKQLGSKVGSGVPWRGGGERTTSLYIKEFGKKTISAHISQIRPT